MCIRDRGHAAGDDLGQGLFGHAEADLVLQPVLGIGTIHIAQVPVSYTHLRQNSHAFQRLALGTASNDLVSNVLGNRLVVRGLHNILATTLSLGTQVGLSLIHI